MEEKKIKPNRNLYRPLAFVFAVVVFGLFLIGLFLPDRELSVKEKRVLAQFPQIGGGRIASGDFADDFELYASDQIPFRDAFTSLKVDVDLAAGKRESEGVYLCRDGFLIERMEKTDTKRLSNTLSAVTAFSNRLSAEPLLVLVPNAVSIYKEKLPAFAVTEDQSAFSQAVREGLAGSGVSYLDLSDTLLGSKNEGDLYYKTDHHWTSLAAKQGARKVLDSLGRNFTDDYTRLSVCDDFIGSLAAKSGLPVGRGDEIDVFAPAQEPVYLVTPGSGEGRRATVYSEEGLLSSDPYTVFLGGNEGMLRIETDQIGAGKLLVFKDSYFNCFLPFLLRSYETIDVIDPRYYSGDLDMLLLQNEYDQVLYFYNMNTFSEDTSLSLVLEESMGGEEK